MALPLPIDIMITIFLKLLVVSLTRFECVCNVWRKIIKSSFVDRGISCAARESQLVLFRHFEGEPPCFKLYTVNLDISSNTFTLSQNPISGFTFKPMLPIYNLGYGLFFLQSKHVSDSAGFLYNPIIRETLHLPPPAINTLEFDMHCDAHGLCFDISTKQYKLVRVWLRTAKQVAEVYTLGSNKWKQITAVLPYQVFGIATPAYGDIHWAVLEPKGYVVSFEVMKEEFKVVPMPRDIASSSCLFTWREELALLTQTANTYRPLVRIWLLRNYDDNTHWEEVCALVFSIPLDTRNFATWDDDIVFDIGLEKKKITDGERRHQLLHWNTKEGRITLMVNESPLPWPLMNKVWPYELVMTSYKFNMDSFSRSPSFA